MTVHTLCVLLLFNVLLICLPVHCQPTVRNKEFGYFNGSAHAKLTNALDLRTSQTGFSFRTCKENGTLFYQRNTLGDIVSLTLLSGEVLFAYSSVIANSTNSIKFIGDFTTNQWVHVMFYINSTHDQGSNLYLSVGDVNKFLSNSVNDSMIFDLEFSNDTVVLVGNIPESKNGFDGCISSGPYFNFQPDINSQVKWNDCPLISWNSCEGTNHCLSSPCQNEGFCTNNDTGYTCSCFARYSGPECQFDNGSSCNETMCGRGICTNSPHGPVCNCTDDTYGPRCQHNGSNPCTSSTCGSGLCSSVNSVDYECLCDAGFTGENCEQDVNDCQSDPCFNHGICHDLINSYECKCNGTGYNGPQCNMDINECLRSPCANGASCFNRFGDFVCVCPPGFTGPMCEVDVNECHPNPCKNWGVCVDGLNSFTCQCEIGYSGTRCEELVDNCIGNKCNPITEICINEPTRHYCICRRGYGGANCTDINECQSNPCLNGATCINGLDKFTCVCSPGFRGHLCQENINECENEPCENGAQCIDETNDYFCECPLGWTGKNCSELFTPCDSNPCQNGGVCDVLPHDHSPGYSCFCPLGFSGYDCDVNNDDCYEITCSYNEICVDGVNSFSCQCNPGYTTDSAGNCTIDINECNSNPCENNATCIDSLDDYRCNCSYGYAGKNCENVIDFCESTPCFNGGHCQSSLGSYSCFCVPGYVGLHCEHSFNACNSDPCVNGATCSAATMGLYLCQCQPGYEGVNCELEINECDPNPCRNGGNCTDLIADFKCDCAIGWTGTQCETNIDECESDPCFNEANCTDQIAGFICECAPGYSGTFCQTNINECENRPCLHNGSCVDGIAEFSCLCNGTGYTGPTCDQEVDECAVAPCVNGGTCTDLINDYFCICERGYVGVHCQIDINECESQPCVNGGTCYEKSDQSIYRGVITGNFTYDQAEGFVCVCAEGYRGINCEVEIDECSLWQPCVNGGSCVDYVADYKCQCTEGFGGRNCSVTLLGCDGRHECANAATCLPYLQDEKQDTHNYTCKCKAGYSGNFCRQSTAISMDEISSLVFPVHENTHRNVSFSFRTTLPHGILVSIDDRLKLYLSNGAVQMEINNKTINLNQPLVNNGYWHEVLVSFGQNTVTVGVNQSQCFDLLCEVLFNQSEAFKNIEKISFGSDPTLTPYTGCMRDIKHNGVLLSSTGAVVTNVEGGCNREPVCQVDSCHRHGVCVDLWTKFRCECARPYIGSSCQFQVQASTFGHIDQNSFALFQLTKPPHRMFNISMFLKTLQPDGAIVLTANSTLTSVRINLINGMLQVTISDESYINATSNLSDGFYHFILVEVLDDKLNVMVDNTRYTEITLPTNIDVTTEMLYLAGQPEPTGSRQRRATPSGGFKGAIQDVQFNGRRLLFHHNDTRNVTFPNEPTPLVPSASSNVLIGQISDPVCGSTNESSFVNPCHNGGHCEVTFNDYVCSCTEGWKGRNCDEPIFCKQVSCPGGLQCNDLPRGGFECVGPATFHQDTVAMYVIHPTAVLDDTLSLSIRTRSINASIIQFRSQSGIIQLELDETGHFKFSFYTQVTNGSVTTNVSIADANWHNITVTTPANGSVSLFVDQSRYYSSISFPDNLIGRIGASPDNLIVIGAIDEGLFKGCLSDVRIGGVSLPFYDQSKLTNHSAATGSTHVAMMSQMMSLGCHGDDVCMATPCGNNGTCRDLFNKRECDCVAGFVDEDCSTNVDDCVGVDCNNGRCVDLVDDYLCNCSTGYVGNRCQLDENECSDQPCFNNATCFNLIGSFECRCSETTVGRLCEIDVSQSCNNEGDEPCENGATCINITSDTKITHTCACPPGYTGQRCEEIINHCENVTCLNNGSCSSNLTSHNCFCATGYSGTFCENFLGGCSGVSCLNNGSCDVTEDGFYCTCTEGYFGRICEVIDLCSKNRDYCMNNGNCSHEKIGDEIIFSCDCPPAYTGSRCLHPNPCLNHTCHNGGVCDITWSTSLSTASSGSEPPDFVVPLAACTCTNDYTGPHCETTWIQSYKSIIILASCVGGTTILLLLLVGIISLVSMVLERRATSGTYSPSKRETTSQPPQPGIEMWTELKPPPTCERLI